MSQSTPARNTLAARLDAQAEAWRPTPGARLIGTAVDIDSRETEFGTYPVITLREDESGNEVAVHAFHTVLKNAFARRPPRIGERLGVRYLGKSPKGYEAYRVVFETAAEPDWNRIGVEAQAEAAVEGIEDVPEPLLEPSEDGIPF
jgi:hypothetical protein